MLSIEDRYKLSGLKIKFRDVMSDVVDLKMERRRLERTIADIDRKVRNLTADLERIDDEIATLERRENNAAN